MVKLPRGKSQKPKTEGMPKPKVNKGDKYSRESEKRKLKKAMKEKAAQSAAAQAQQNIAPPSSAKKQKRTSNLFSAGDADVNPSLAALFASSSRPVQPPSKNPAQRHSAGGLIPVTRTNTAHIPNEEDDNEDDEVLSSANSDVQDGDVPKLPEQGDHGQSKINIPANARTVFEGETSQPRKRKRKSGLDGDDLEGQYMLKLAKEEEKEEADRKAQRKLKRQRLATEGGPDISEEVEVELAAESDEEHGATSDTPEAPLDVPMHESLVLEQDRATDEVEKASRTVFLANVSATCIMDKKDKKTLIEHMESFFPLIPAPKEGHAKHKVESIRFRSTAYSGGGLPKKAAFATKDIMVATTKSTNAYVGYTNAFAAREAVKHLNTSMVLDRHLRVDSVAHPAKTDHRRCVFVGNVGFVDDESMMDEGGENERKRSKIPADVEEGLWRQFGKAGKVESVRVVRDEKTRVGKGFAYVQFEDANAVEAALLFNDKKYPPMLPRLLRVIRCKAPAKTALAAARASKSAARAPTQGGRDNPNNTKIYNPKMSAQQQSMGGRASKLLGKAGAAQFKKGDANKDILPDQRNKGLATESNVLGPEKFVMEGYRASAKNGKPKDLKFKAVKKSVGAKGGKTRKSARSVAFKKAAIGGKKGGK